MAADDGTLRFGHQVRLFVQYSAVYLYSNAATAVRFGQPSAYVEFRTRHELHHVQLVRPSRYAPILVLMVGLPQHEPQTIEEHHWH